MICVHISAKASQVEATLAMLPDHVRKNLGLQPTKRRLSLDHIAPRPPHLDPALIPVSLRAWIVDEAERIGVPIEAVAGPAIVAAGATIGTTALIQVMEHNPGWLEPGTLRGMLVGASGTKKTPSAKAALHPLEQIEASKRREFEASTHKRNAQLAILNRDIAAISKGRRASGASATTGEEARLESLLEEQANVPLAPARIVTNDATVESLGSLNQANPRGMFLFRDELEGLLNTMQRDGHQNDRTFFLESYNAKAAYTFDRIGRGTVSVDPLALSMYGLTQPSMLAQHIASLDRHAGGDGFFARFQLVTLLDAREVGSGQNRLMDDAAFAQAMAVFRTLDEQALAAIKGQPRGHHRTVRFAPDAQEHFDGWRASIEERVLALGETALAAYCAKTPAAGARMALIVHLLDKAGGHPATEVTLEQARQATGLMDHFLAHAEILYAREQHPHARLARSIANKIDDGLISDGMSLTDIGGLFDGKARGSMDDVRAALDLLSNLNWLRVEERPKAGVRSTFVVRLIVPTAPMSGTDTPLKS